MTDVQTIKIPGGELRIYPAVAPQDASDMCVLDVHGVTVLVRRRNLGGDRDTFVHVDTDGTSGVFVGPLVIEVRNCGENTYGAGGDL